MNLRLIKQEIQTTETIDMITETLGDIATIKLKEIRKIIEHNVRFFQEISGVYGMVKLIAKRRRISSIRKENGRIVCILVSSNDRLYGDLDLEVTKTFSKNTANLVCDRIVIGKLGDEFLRSFKFSQKYSTFLFKTGSPSFQEVTLLSKIIYSYSKVLVFHPKFITVLNQVPTISDLSFSQLEQISDEKLAGYILEPDLDKMIDFFENQIAINLLQAIFAEVDICRIAGRMISMNQAELNARKLLKQQRRDFIKMKRELVGRGVIALYGNLISKNR